MIRAHYTTLTSVKRQKGIPQGSTDPLLPSTDDDRLQEALEWASGWITDQTFGRVFVPVYDSRYYRRDDVYYPGYDSSDGLLQLGADLLAVDTLTNGDGTAIAGTQYELLPLNRWPKQEIGLRYGGGAAWNFDHRGSTGTVTGFWGYHDDYPRAWKTAGSLVGTLNADDTAAIVSTYAPYEVGDYLRLTSSGTQELVQVTAIGTVTGSLMGTLTLERGVNGTTGAAHGTATDAPRYQQVRQIQKACNDLAVFYYDHRDAVESAVEVIEYALRLETKIPGRIWNAVQLFARSRFEATS